MLEVVVDATVVVEGGRVLVAAGELSSFAAVVVTRKEVVEGPVVPSVVGEGEVTCSSVVAVAG